MLKAIFKTLRLTILILADHKQIALGMPLCDGGVKLKLLTFEH
jgi:hypothetical protein